jgi:DNA-binding transcriptional LysR family regulator
VDVKQLTALVAVADAGSVTRAAELLHLVQPAVTRQIHTLEQELGVPLFERSRAGMELTESGRLMLERARRVLSELERARAEIRPNPGVLQGIVAVGLLASTAELLAEQLVTTVLQEHPAVRLRIVSGYAGHVRQWLDAGDIDLGLLYNVKSASTLNVRPLLAEKLWAVAPPDSGLDIGRPVTLDEVASHPVVMPSAPHGIRTLVAEACTRLDIGLNIVVETNEVSVQKRLVRAGHGWTILPGIAVADDVGAGLLSAAPLHSPEVERTVALALPSTPKIPPAVHAVADLLVHQMREAVDRGDWPSAHWMLDK